MSAKTRVPVYLLPFLLGAAAAGSDPRLEPGVGGQPAAGPIAPAAASAGADDLSGFEDQCREIEAGLAGEESRPRENLLVMYGRASAASGRYDLAAAAYAMFLNEFGSEHPYSARVAMRLADCLTPFDLDHVTIVHEEGGPKFTPTWRMGFAPGSESLARAIDAYERAAELAETDAGAGRALLRMGWVYRALGDWQASTETWDRCAAQTSGAKSAADALWLAAENLAWTGQPASAAGRLRELTAAYPGDSRSAGAESRVEEFEAESRRSAAWLADPVTSLQAEIKDRAGVRSANDVYTSVLTWLRREHHLAAQIAICRWACEQTDWPLERRLACHHDLVTALLDLPTAGAAERQEAADVLGRIVDLAPRDDWAIPAALRRSRLLSELGRFDLADRTLDGIADHEVGVRYEPHILAERIRVLLDRGDIEQAAVAFDTLSEAYPEHKVTTELAPRFVDDNEDGAQ
ncbi:MAG: tetratricopeptide repeat protein [bacterium]|nr:tetratricopeptide repeat protein [bacterium]